MLYNLKISLSPSGNLAGSANPDVNPATLKSTAAESSSQPLQQQQQEEQEQRTAAAAMSEQQIGSSHVVSSFALSQSSKCMTAFNL